MYCCGIIEVFSYFRAYIRFVYYWPKLGTGCNEPVVCLILINVRLIDVSYGIKLYPFKSFYKHACNQQVLIIQLLYFTHHISQYPHCSFLIYCTCAKWQSGRCARDMRRRYFPNNLRIILTCITINYIIKPTTCTSLNFILITSSVCFEQASYSSSGDNFTVHAVYGMYLAIMWTSCYHGRDGPSRPW